MASFYIAPVAKAVPYDPGSGPLVSINVQDAIDELANGGGNTATSTLTVGRSGNPGSGTWLLNETVPSNLTGKRVATKNAKIVEIFSDNQKLDTYVIGVYSHDGDEVNLTLLDTLTVTVARGADKNVSIPVAENKQIGIKIISGSANNISSGVLVRGTTT